MALRGWARRNKAAGDETVEVVREFYRTHIGTTALDCARFTGLSPERVRRARYLLREEWYVKKSLDRTQV